MPYTDIGKLSPAECELNAAKYVESFTRAQQRAKETGQPYTIWYIANREVFIELQADSESHDRAVIIGMCYPLFTVHPNDTYTW